MNIDQARLAEVPKIVVAPNVVVYSPDGVYSVKWVQRASATYTVFLILQYFCFFLGLPFEDVGDKPGVCLLGTFVLIITVSFHCFIQLFIPSIANILQVFISFILMPLSATSIPNRLSYISHVIIAVSQIVCWVFILVSTVLVIRSGSFHLTLYKSNGEISETIDMRTLSVITDAITLSICTVSTFLAILNTYLYGKLLYRLLNRIDRHQRNGSDMEFEIHETLRPGSSIFNYEQKNGTILKFPDEVLRSVERSFV